MPTSSEFPCVSLSKLSCKMLAVKFVVKLYDVPAEDGNVTAFDSFGNTIFLGTEKG